MTTYWMSNILFDYVGKYLIVATVSAILIRIFNAKIFNEDA